MSVYKGEKAEHLTMCFDSIYRQTVQPTEIILVEDGPLSCSLDEAIAKDATYAELYRLKGLALLQQKKNKDARSAFDKAKELGDEQVDALIQKYF